MKKDGEVAIKGKDVSLEAAGKIVGKAATSLTRAALRSAHAQRRQSDLIDLLYCHRELSAPGRQLFEILGKHFEDAHVRRRQRLAIPLTAEASAAPSLAATTRARSFSRPFRSAEFSDRVRA